MRRLRESWVIVKGGPKASLLALVQLWDLCHEEKKNGRNQKALRRRGADAPPAPLPDEILWRGEATGRLRVRLLDDDLICQSLEILDVNEDEESREPHVRCPWEAWRPLNQERVGALGMDGGRDPSLPLPRKLKRDPGETIPFRPTIAGGQMMAHGDYMNFTDRICRRWVISKIRPLESRRKTKGLQELF